MRLRNGFQRYALAVQCTVLLVERGHQIDVVDSSVSAGRNGPCWPHAARQVQKMATMSVFTI